MTHCWRIVKKESAQQKAKGKEGCDKTHSLACLNFPLSLCPSLFLCRDCGVDSSHTPNSPNPSQRYGLIVFSAKFLISDPVVWVLNVSVNLTFGDLFVGYTRCQNPSLLYNCYLQI